MIVRSKIKGVKIIINKCFFDNRGYFKELLKEKDLNKKFPFVVMSYSKKNVIRGMHLQTKNSQGKFVSVLKGKIFDVIIDLRKKSPTYLKWESFEISSKNKNLLFIPKGCAHGFLTTANNTCVIYHIDNFYNPKYEKVIKYNDKKFNIKWPIPIKTVSKKDA